MLVGQRCNSVIWSCTTSQIDLNMILEVTPTLHMILEVPDVTCICWLICYFKLLSALLPAFHLPVFPRCSSSYQTCISIEHHDSSRSAAIFTEPHHLNAEDSRSCQFRSLWKCWRLHTYDLLNARFYHKKTSISTLTTPPLEGSSAKCFRSRLAPPVTPAWLLESIQPTLMLAILVSLDG